jgi:hypothetical protein
VPFRSDLATRRFVDLQFWESLCIRGWIAWCCGIGRRIFALNIGRRKEAVRRTNISVWALNHEENDLDMSPFANFTASSGLFVAFTGRHECGSYVVFVLYRCLSVSSNAKARN